MIRSSGNFGGKSRLGATSFSHLRDLCRRPPHGERQNQNREISLTSPTTNRRKLEKRHMCRSLGIDALKRLAFDVQKLSRQAKPQQQAEIHRLWNCQVGAEKHFPEFPPGGGKEFRGACLHHPQPLGKNQAGFFNRIVASLRPAPAFAGR